MIVTSLSLDTSSSVAKKLLFKSYISIKFGSYISTLLGPSNIKFFKISIPRPLNPIIKILILVNFIIVSEPIIPNCLEYKSISKPISLFFLSI